MFVLNYFIFVLSKVLKIMWFIIVIIAIFLAQVKEEYAYLGSGVTNLYKLLDLTGLEKQDDQPYFWRSKTKSTSRPTLLRTYG